MSKAELSTPGDTEVLYALFEAKAMLLRELRELTLQQGDSVSKQDMPELLNLLARKQSLMDRLMSIQEKMSAFANDAPDDRVWRGPERRTACRAFQAECERLVRELLVLENRSIDQMSQQRDIVASQLQQVTDAMRLSRAYGFDAPQGGENDLGASLSLDG